MRDLFNFSDPADPVTPAVLAVELARMIFGGLALAGCVLFLIAFVGA